MNDQAEQLTRFLTERTSNYDLKSPLMKRVEAGIETIAREIAAEIIAENPEIREAIRGRTVQLIRQALRDDAYLSGVVVKSVAAGLQQYIMNQEDDDA